MEKIYLIGIDPDELLERIKKLLDERIKNTIPVPEPKIEYLSRAEVANLLKISLPTLNEWSKLGWLQSYKMGNRVLYKSMEVATSISQLSLKKHKKYIV